MTDYFIIQSRVTGKYVKSGRSECREWWHAKRFETRAEASHWWGDPLPNGRYLLVRVTTTLTPELP